VGVSSLDRANFLAKYLKKSRKKKASTTSPKVQTLSISERDTKREEIISSLGIGKKVLFPFALCLLTLIFGIVLLPNTENRFSHLEFYHQMFAVRQRVNLIL